MSNPLEDNSPALFMEARAIAQRCRERLEVLPADDYLRPSIELMLEMAETEAAKQASFLPY